MTAAIARVVFVVIVVAAAPLSSEGRRAWNYNVSTRLPVGQRRGLERTLKHRNNNNDNNDYNNDDDDNDNDRKKSRDRRKPQRRFAYKNPVRRTVYIITRLHAIMNTPVALLLAACAAVVLVATDCGVAGAPPKDKEAPAGSAYTTKYDNIDVDQVLASKRLVNNYVQCLLDKKPCTPEAAELRST